MSADTPILQLIQLLARDPDRPFLVLQGNEIVGLVASADLNSTKSRASLYLLMAHFEAELVKLVRRHIGTEVEHFSGLLTEPRLERLIQEQIEARERQINLSLIHYLYLSDLTCIVSKNPELRLLFGFTSRAEADRELSFTPLRNPLSHQNSPVITSPSQVPVINDSVDRLIRLSAHLSNNTK